MQTADINNAFQTGLGRAATQAEIDYFTKLGEGYHGEGQLSPYEVQQFVGSTPEAQYNSLNKYADIYANKLGESDSLMLGKAQNQLTSQFRQLGRPSSSGYIAAFAQAAQNLAAQRQGQIAQFWGGGLGNVMNNQVNYGQGALDRAYNEAASQKQFERDRTLAEENYARQKDDYNTQRRQAQQGGLVNSLVGLGAGLVGSSFGGIAGGYLAGKAASYAMS